MKLSDKLTIANWLTRHELLTNGGVVRQSCVASTGVLTDVLRTMGISAKPICVSAVAMTEGWLRKLEAGERPDPERALEVMDEWWEKDRAWSCGVAYDPNPVGSAYSGHAVVVANGKYLCDPSLDQMARPERDLPLTPFVIPFEEMGVPNVKPFLDGEGSAVLGLKPNEGEEGQQFFVFYSAFPADLTMFNAPDYKERRRRYGHIIDKVSKEVKRLDYIGEDLASTKLPDLPDAIDDPALVQRPRSREELARTVLTARHLDDR